MLKYEKALHFDKYYEKWEGNSALRYFWVFIRNAICYTLLFYVLKMGADKIPDVYAWRHIHTWITLGNVPLIKPDIFYYAAGLLMTGYASIQLHRITVQNHSVKRENSKTPEKILRDGCYSQKRHPMYGTFLLFYMGFLLSFRSLDAMGILCLVIVFQYLNAVFEEKRILKSELGEDYRKYREEVKAIFFDQREKILIAACLVICVLAFIF